MSRHRPETLSSLYVLTLEQEVLSTTLESLFHTSNPFCYLLYSVVRNIIIYGTRNVTKEVSFTYSFGFYILSISVNKTIFDLLRSSSPPSDTKVSTRREGTRPSFPRGSVLPDFLPDSSVATPPSLLRCPPEVVCLFLVLTVLVFKYLPSQCFRPPY